MADYRVTAWGGHQAHGVATLVADTYSDLELIPVSSFKPGTEVFCIETGYTYILGVNNTDWTIKPSSGGGASEEKILEIVEEITGLLSDLDSDYFTEEEKENLVAAINAVTDKSTIEMTVSATPTEGYLKTYVLTQGENEIGTIDIPKDLVVTAGSSVTVEYDEETGKWIDSEGEEAEGVTVAGNYLKLRIANQDEPVYINMDLLNDNYYTKSETNNLLNNYILKAGDTGIGTLSFETEELNTTATIDGDNGLIFHISGGTGLQDVTVDSSGVAVETEGHSGGTKTSINAGNINIQTYSGSSAVRYTTQATVYSTKIEKNLLENSETTNSYTYTFPDETGTLLVDADLEDYYTKTEIDAMIGDISSTLDAINREVV